MAVIDHSSIWAGRTGCRPLVERSLELRERERGQCPTVTRIPRPQNKRIAGHVLHKSGNAAPAVLARIKQCAAELAFAESIPPHRGGRELPMRRAGNTGHVIVACLVTCRATH